MGCLGTQTGREKEKEKKEKERERRNKPMNNGLHTRKSGQRKMRR